MLLVSVMMTIVEPSRHVREVESFKLLFSAHTLT